MTAQKDIQQCKFRSSLHVKTSPVTAVYLAACVFNGDEFSVGSTLCDGARTLGASLVGRLGRDLALDHLTHSQRINSDGCCCYKTPFTFNQSLKIYIAPLKIPIAQR